ncbi:MAG: CsgG/HfaB family protein [Halofilum sp. (in: g-proteobacteria)]|nr:CsgG/HfaB family protein [Halofilum sp. (in: g-proteobacteria)]
MLFRRALTAVMAVGALIAASAATADYVAYSVTDEGRSPWPERLDDIDSAALVNVEWGNYVGPKKRLAVLKVENNTNQKTIDVNYRGQGVSAKVTSQGVPVNGIDALLTDSLFRSGRFRVMERQKVSKVLQEQDFGASGRVSAPSAAKIGKVLGAETLVQAVVTEYAPDFEGSNIGLGGLTDGLLGGIKLGKKSSLVAMNIRMFDAETGEVIFTKQVKAVVGESSFGFGAVGWGGGGAAGGAFESFSKTPIGRAVIACINKAVFELVKEVGAQPAAGKVVKASGSTVYVNIGEDSLNVGDSLTVKAVGEELIDPETGISLGAMETEVAKLRVGKTAEKFSVATVVSKNGNFGRGDKVVADRAPKPLRFAEKWEGPSTQQGGGSSSPKAGGG